MTSEPTSALPGRNPRNPEGGGQLRRGAVAAVCFAGLTAVQLTPAVAVAVDPAPVAREASVQKQKPAAAKPVGKRPAKATAKRKTEKDAADTGTGKDRKGDKASKSGKGGKGAAPAASGKSTGRDAGTSLPVSKPGTSDWNPFAVGRDTGLGRFKSTTLTAPSVPAGGTSAAWKSAAAPDRPSGRLLNPLTAAHVPVSRPAAPAAAAPVVAAPAAAAPVAAVPAEQARKPKPQRRAATAEPFLVTSDNKYVTVAEGQPFAVDVPIKVDGDVSGPVKISFTMPSGGPGRVYCNNAGFNGSSCEATVNWAAGSEQTIRISGTTSGPGTFAFTNMTINYAGTDHVPMNTPVIVTPPQHQALPGPFKITLSVTEAPMTVTVTPGPEVTGEPGDEVDLKFTVNTNKSSDTGVTQLTSADLAAWNVKPESLVMSPAPAAGTCDFTTGCSLPTIGSISIAAKGTIPLRPATGAYTNGQMVGPKLTAKATRTAPRPGTADGSGTAPVKVILPDVSIETVSPTPSDVFTPGQEFTQVFTVKSTVAVTRNRTVKFTPVDTSPPRLEISGIEFEGTTPTGATCVVGTGRADKACTLPEMPANTPFKIKVTGKIAADAPVGSTKLVATVFDSRGNDSDPANNKTEPAFNILHPNVEAGAPVADLDTEPTAKGKLTFTVGSDHTTTQETKVTFDSLPAELKVLDIKLEAPSGSTLPAGATCDVAARTCTVPSLEGGKELNVVVEFETAEDIEAKDYPVTLRVKHPNDADPADDVVTATVHVKIKLVDFSVTAEEAKKEAQPGDELELKYKVSSDKDSEKELKLTAAAEGLTLGDVSVEDAATGNTWTCDQNTHTCSLPANPSVRSARAATALDTTVTVKVKIPTDAPAKAYPVTITAKNSSDRTPANNVGTTMVNLPGTDLALAAVTPAGKAEPGSAHKVVFKLTSNRVTKAPVKVEFTKPAGFTVKSITGPDGFTCDAASGVCTKADGLDPVAFTGEFTVEGSFAKDVKPGAKAFGAKVTSRDDVTEKDNKATVTLTVPRPVVVAKDNKHAWMLGRYRSWLTNGGNGNGHGTGHGTGHGNGGKLAATGAEVAGAAGAGTLLVGAGLFLRRISRRRES